jgi:hypothetical protein
MTQLISIAISMPRNRLNTSIDASKKPSAAICGTRSDSLRYSIQRSCNSQYRGYAESPGIAADRLILQNKGKLPKGNGIPFRRYPTTRLTGLKKPSGEFGRIINKPSFRRTAEQESAMSGN